MVVGGGGGGLQVTLVFCFGPKPKFCSFDLDLDQAEQQLAFLFDNTLPSLLFTLGKKLIT